MFINIKLKKSKHIHVNAYLYRYIYETVDRQQKWEVLPVYLVCSGRYVYLCVDMILHEANSFGFSFNPFMIIENECA